LAGILKRGLQWVGRRYQLQLSELPIWLSDYGSHVPLIGVPPALPSADLNPVEDLKAQALMDSLSPGVRAHCEGAHLAREAARKREHEREEAEYAAFIEERLQRLGRGRSTGSRGR
jgi:hypothetical protein